MNNVSNDEIVIQLNNNNIINDKTEITVIEENIKDNYRIKLNNTQILNELTNLVSKNSIIYNDLFFNNKKELKFNLVNPVILNKKIKSYYKDDIDESEDNYKYEELTDLLKDLQEFSNNESYKNFLSSFYNKYKPFINYKSNDLNKKKFSAIKNDKQLSIDKNIDSFLSYELQEYNKIRLIKNLNINTGKRSEIIDSKEGCQAGLQYTNDSNIINIYDGDKVKISGYIYYIDDVKGTEVFSIKKYIKYIKNLEINDKVKVYFNTFVFDIKQNLIENIKGTIIENIIDGYLIQLDNYIYFNSKKVNTLKLYFEKYTGFFVYNKDYTKFKFYKKYLKNNDLSYNIYFHLVEYKQKYLKFINPVDIQELLYIYYINNYDLTTLENINNILKTYNLNDIDINLKSKLCLDYLLYNNLVSSNNINKINNFKYEKEISKFSLLNNIDKYKNSYIDTDLNKIIYLNSFIGQSNILLLNLINDIIVDNKELFFSNTNIDYIYNFNINDDKFPEFKDIINNIKIQKNQGKQLINYNNLKSNKTIKDLIKFYNNYNDLLKDYVKQDTLKQNIYILNKLRNKLKFINSYNSTKKYTNYLGNKDEIDFDKMYGNIEYNDKDNYNINYNEFYVTDEDDNNDIEEENIENNNNDILKFLINDLDINLNNNHIKYIIDNIHKNKDTSKDWVEKQIIKEKNALLKKYENKKINDVQIQSYLEKKRKIYKKLYDDKYNLEIICYMIIFIMNKYPSIHIRKLNPKCVKYFSYKTTEDKSLTKYFSSLIIQYNEQKDERFSRFNEKKLNEINEILSGRIHQIIQDYPMLKSNIKDINEIINNNYEKHKKLNMLFKPNNNYNNSIKSDINIHKTKSLIPKSNNIKNKETALVLENNEKINFKNIFDDQKNIYKFINKRNKNKVENNISTIFKNEIYNIPEDTTGPMDLRPSANINYLYNNYIYVFLESIDNLLSTEPKFIKIEKNIKNIFIYSDAKTTNTHNINFYLFLQNNLIILLSKIFNKKVLNIITDDQNYINNILPLIINNYEIIIKNNINLNLDKDPKIVFSLHLFLFLTFLINIINLSIGHNDIEIRRYDKNEIVTSIQLILLIYIELNDFILMNDSNINNIKQELENIREKIKLEKMNRASDPDERKLQMKLKEIGLKI